MEELLARLAISLGRQMELQVELVKAETVRDGHALARDLAPAALALPLAGLGYTFLFLGIALALGPWLGVGGGFVAVGLFSLVGGAGAARLCVHRLRARGTLPQAHVARRAGPEEALPAPPAEMPWRFGTSNDG